MMIVTLNDEESGGLAVLAGALRCVMRGLASFGHSRSTITVWRYGTNRMTGWADVCLHVAPSLGSARQ
jgi:hypothetical protein